ncbi:MAG: hypothetical protein HY078_03510 [Elusimicrobia bacterium]|nr:hypothetical protein [Elusimicrobiota bacterium]
MKRTGLEPDERWVLARLAAAAVFVHFFRLGWGLPDWSRTLAVFESREEVERLAPRMVRLREEVYSQYRDVNLDMMKGQPKPGEALSEDIVLNGMRSHLLQPRSTDEQQVIGALSRLKKAARDRRLPFVVYGYLYLFLVGLFLLAGHAAGALALTSDIAHYFTHPQHMAGIYVFARAAGAAAALGTTAIVYAAARRWFGWRTAAAAAMLYCLDPITVINGHLVKPWGVTALFEAGLAALCLRIACAGGGTRDVLAAGVLAGLAGATSYLYALTWLWVPLARAQALKWRLPLREFPALAASATAGAVVFLVTNPQVIFHLDDILRLRHEFNFGDPTAGLLFPCLTDNFLTFPGALYLAASLSALPAARREAGPERFLWLALAPALVFFGMVIGGSAHHLLPLYPVIALLAARGALRRGSAAGRLLLMGCLAAAAGASGVWLRDAAVDHLAQGGRWLREHALPSASIAMTHAVPGASFPPFRYLGRRLVYLPNTERALVPDTDFVVNAYFDTPEFAKTEEFRNRYALELDLQGSSFSYHRLRFPCVPFSPYPSRPVQIWSRR